MREGPMRGDQPARLTDRPLHSRDRERVRPRGGRGRGRTTGPADGSTGTWTAAQAAEHLSDPDEQRSCLLVLLGSDESPDA